MARPSNNIPINSPEEERGEGGNENSSNSSHGFWDRLDGSQISKEVQKGFADTRADGEVGMKEQFEPLFEGDVTDIEVVSEMNRWWDNLNEKVRSYIKNHPESPLSSDSSSPLANFNPNKHIEISDDMDGEAYLQKYEQKAQELFTQLRQLEAEVVAKEMKLPNKMSEGSDIIESRNMEEEPDQPNSTPKEINAPDMERSSAEGRQERQQLTRPDIKEHLRTNLSDNPTKQEISDVYGDLWQRVKAAGGIQFRKGEDILIEEGAENKDMFQNVVKPRLDRVREEIDKTPDRKDERVIESFSEFDLKEKLKSNAAVKDIWDEIEKTGVYLSVKGPCYARGRDGWKKYKSLKAYYDHTPGGEGKITKEGIDSSEVKKVLKQDIDTLKQRAQFSDDEEKAPDQESATGPVSSQEIFSLLESNLPKSPSEDKREAVYKNIWEQVKERGEIETLDGGSYRREQETLGGKTKSKWFRISPDGSRGTYGHAETRASLENDSEVDMFYRKFFKDIMREYEDELRRRQSDEIKDSRPTDTTEGVPEGPKEADDSIPMKEPLTMDYAEDLSAEVRNELREGQSLYRAYIHYYREYQNQKKAEDMNVSEDIKEAFNLGEQDSLAYKLQDLSQRIIKKSQTTADIKAFLDIAPKESMTTLKKKARKALEDDEFRRSFLKAENQKTALQEIRRDIRQNGENIETKLREIDTLIANLDENPSQYVDQAEDKLDQLKGQVTNQTDAEEREMQVENNVEIDDMVMLTEKGSPRWSEYHAVEDIIQREGKEPLINTDKDVAYRPASKFNLKESDENEDEETTERSNEKDIKNQSDQVMTENRPENIADYLDREQVRQIIGEHNNAASASEEILSHEGFFWDEKRYVAQTDDGLWKMHRRDGTTDAKAFFETEMISRVLRAISDHEAFTSSADKPPEDVTEQIGAFTDGVIDIFDAFIDALPEDEGWSDEVELKTSYRKLHDFVVNGGHQVTPDLLQKYRDRFVQVINYYRKHKSSVFERSGVTLDRIKNLLRQADVALENFE